VACAAQASHFIGGQLHYEYLGANNYQVTLTAYRDCSSNTDFDVFVPIGIFNSAGVLIETLEIDIENAVISSVDVQSNTPCFADPLSLCIEEAIYIDTINLPDIAGGYTLTYQRCCRNFSIVNVLTGSDVGITLTTEIPDVTINSNNSNPEFATQPPFIICLNAQFEFDHAATDADGDSLSYALCAPLNSTVDAFFINPPGPPPYPELVYNAGYSPAYPLDANPPFTIDPVTGLLTGTANTLGQFVISICTSEWRNGQLLNVTNRDIQLNVTSCAPVAPPQISTQPPCSGLNVQFANFSTPGLTYHWDFGVASLANDTSNVFEPAYSYTTPGIYDVTLILNPGLYCADTATISYNSSAVLDPNILPTSSICVGSNLLYDFSATGNFSNGNTVAWNFGSASVPANATSSTVNDVVLGPPGTAVNVLFSITQNACTETDTLVVNVPPDIVAAIDTQPANCNGSTFSFNNLSQNATSYTWDFGAPGQADNSTSAVPSYTYPGPGSYTVRLIASSAITCPDTAFVTVVAVPDLSASIVSNSHHCNTNVLVYDFTASVNSLGNANYNWDFGANAMPANDASLNPSNIYLGPAGTIAQVGFYVEENGCTDSAFVSINIPQDVVAQFAPQTIFCAGTSFTFQNQSQNANNYAWDFGLANAGDNSTATNPTFDYINSGTYEVQLIASATDLCPDTTYQTFVASASLDPQIVEVAHYCYNNQLVYDFEGVGNTNANATYEWNFGDAATPGNANTAVAHNVFLTEPGLQTIVLFVITQDGCADSATVTVNVPESIVAQFAPQTLFCAGTSFTFQNQSQNATNYAWDFGQSAVGDNSSATNPTFDFINSGTYEVQLIASATDLCPDTTYQTFVASASLDPQIVEVAHYCYNNQLVYDFEGVGNTNANATYEWNFGDAATPGNANTAVAHNVFLTEPGLQTIVLFVITQDGCADSATVTVNVPESIVAAIAPQTVFCNGTTMAFNNQSQNASSYVWDFGDVGANDTSVQINPTYTYQNIGSYTVQLIASAADMCPDTTSAQVEVYPVIEPYFAVQTPVCFEGNSMSFDAQGASSMDALFNWNFDINATPATSDEASPADIHYAQAGQYTITLTISENGCAETYTSQVEVLPNPIFNALCDTLQTCNDTTATFEASAQFATGVVYTWDFGDGATSYLAAPTHTYTNAGLYNVQVYMHTTSDCIDSASYLFENVIEIFPKPIAGFNLSLQEINILGEEVTIASTAQGATQCNYFLSDGGIYNTFDAVHPFEQNGIIAIQQIVVNEYGCVDTEVQSVEVNGFLFYAPNAFTPDGDGTNDVWKPIMAGVSEYQMQIFNRWGELIFETTDQHQPWTGNVNSGEYYAQDDAYLYQVVIKDMRAIPHKFKGHVVVVR
jgi:gliding motility-associated-like protein